MVKTKRKKWEEYGAFSFRKQFGPFTFCLSRHWDYKEPGPDRYDISLWGIDLPIPSVMISDLGVDWHDDACDRLACRDADKIIKRTIRSWAK